MDTDLKWILMHTEPSLHEEISFEHLYSQYKHATTPALSLSEFVQRLMQVYALDDTEFSSIEYVQQKQLQPQHGFQTILTNHICNGSPLAKEIHCDNGHVTCNVLNKDVSLEKCGLVSHYNSSEDLLAILEGVKLLRPCLGSNIAVGHAKKWQVPGQTEDIVTYSSDACATLLALTSVDSVCAACNQTQSPEMIVEQMLFLLKQCPLPDTVAEFISEQILHSVRKFIRWSPRMTEACAAWYDSAPSVYKKWRQQKLLLLPHPSSLKAKTENGDRIEDVEGDRECLRLQMPVTLVEKIKSGFDEEFTMIVNESKDTLVKLKGDADVCFVQLEGAIEDLVVKEGDAWSCLMCPCPEKDVAESDEEVFTSVRSRRTRVKREAVVVSEDESVDEVEEEEEESEETTEEKDPYHRASCALCGQECVQRGALASHVRWQHKLQWSSYHLAVQTYSDKDQLKAHLEALVKEKEELASLKCPACNVLSTSVQQLHTHIKEHDVSVRKEAQFRQQMEELEASAGVEGFGYKVQCPFCDRTRSGVASMKKHLTVWHSEEEGYVSRRMAFFDELDQLKKKGPLECWRCGESCHGLYNLKYHVRCKCVLNPARTRYYHCAKCRSKFSSQEALQRHTETRHKEAGNEYQCDQCGKSYASASGLNTHRRSFHAIVDKTPIQWHVCPHCNKVLYKMYDYKRHLLSHSSQKTAHCDVCGKMLKSVQSLQQHKAHIHFNQYPYKCEQCGHGVRKRAYLLRHKCGIVKRSQPNETVPPQPPPVQSSPPSLPDLTTKKPVEVAATFEHSAFAALESYLLPGDPDKMSVSPDGSSLLPYTLDSQVLSAMFPSSSSQQNDILLPTAGPSQLMEGDLPSEPN